MKKKYSLRKSIVFVTSLMFFVGNIFLVLNSISMSLDTFEVFVEDILFSSIQISKDMSLLKKQVFVYGIIIGIISSTVGSILVNHFTKKILSPLDDLTKHISKVDSENLISQIEINSSIYEIDRLIDAFNSMTQKIQNLFNIHKEFSVYVAHEFRTPLAVMQTQIDVYEKNPNTNTSEFFSSLRSQIIRLNSLISSILSFTKIDSERTNELIPIDILVEEVFEDLDSEAEKKNISLILHNHSRNEPEIIGNHTLMYQALLNLIHNSIKYIDINGKIDVDIYEKNDDIRIMVSDDGCGVPKEDEARIFMPLFRCENSSNTVGNGIGLAFTKKVIEHHKGNIKYVRVKKGSCFEIKLHRFKENI